MLLGAPLALGFWCGLFTIIPITLVIVWRLLDEKFLAKNGRQKNYVDRSGKIGPLLSLLSQNADLHTRLREPIRIKSSSPRSLILTISLLWFNFRIARDSSATR
jgi:hypothetical protein